MDPRAFLRMAREKTTDIISYIEEQGARPIKGKRMLRDLKQNLTRHRARKFAKWKLKVGQLGNNARSDPSIRISQSHKKKKSHSRYKQTVEES